MQDPVVSATVNGRRQELCARSGTPLITALRNDLGLTGARTGCAIGVCGACTVIVDGEPVRACVTTTLEVEGRDIITPEGLGSPDRPHPTQLAFLREEAAQCGYCVNGIIMGTVAAMRADDGTSDPSPPEWLDEHVCRCGAHTRLKRAVSQCLSGEARQRADELGAARSQANRVVAAGSVEHDAGNDPRLDAERVESWMRLLPDGTVEARVGKVELGQGIRAAMQQIIASQIGLPYDHVTIAPSATGESVDQGVTAGSNSVQVGGMAVASAAVAFRRLLLQRAGARLGAEPHEVTLEGTAVVRSGTGARRVELSDLFHDGPIEGRIDAGDEPDWRAVPLGAPVERSDLRTKLTGASAYVHDLQLPGMLHVRPVLPPSVHAEIERLDVRLAQEMPGVVKVVVDDRLLLVIAEREEQAVRAAERLSYATRWSPGHESPSSSTVMDAMQRSERRAFVAEDTLRDPLPDGVRLRRTYSQPYQAHASIAPSCAVARVSADGSLEVHTHSQGIYGLRTTLCELLSMDERQVHVRHLDGPGCYGQNLADDAAALASVAAREVPGRAVRLLFSVEDEFGWEPLGPAMSAELEAVVREGRIIAWRHEVVTDVHQGTRTGADRVIAGWLGSGRLVPEHPPPRNGGAHNTAPMYDVAEVRAVAHYVEGPRRTGPLRALGAFLNTFAGESFVDELADLVDADPLEFRLQHLSDPRAAAALRVAADQLGWVPRTGPSGRGQGIAIARYASEKAYVATGVVARVDDRGNIGVERVVVACDAGTVINPRGAANQLEGGTIQGLSRGLHEAVTFDGHQVTSRSWFDYPVISFSEIPSIEVHLLVPPDGEPPLGIGEAALGPAAAALANAIDDARGIRLRHLPFTSRNVLEQLHAMPEAEAHRILL